MNRRHFVLAAAASTVVLLVAGTLAYQSRVKSTVTSPAPVADSALMRSYSPVLGPTDAPVTIVEFFDPACEACRAFHPIVSQIKAKYPNKVRVVLRYTPLHRPSKTAIAILEAARLQGVFEPVLEALYNAQDRWAPHGGVPQDPWDFLGNTGLDIPRARQDVKSPEISFVIKQDAADVAEMGVRQTPTFFVNGKPLPKFGARELQDLVRREVEALN